MFFIRGPKGKWVGARRKFDDALVFMNNKGLGSQVEDRDGKVFAVAVPYVPVHEIVVKELGVGFGKFLSLRTYVTVVPRAS
jgi:hypothetical protein